MNERACSLKWWTLRKLLALPSPRRITQWRITSGIATIEEHTAHYAQARISCAYGRIRSVDHVDPGSCRKISWKRLFPSANRSLVLDTLRKKTYSLMENRSSLLTCVGRSTFFCFCDATFWFVSSTHFLFSPRIIRRKVAVPRWLRNGIGDVIKELCIIVDGFTSLYIETKCMTTMKESRDINYEENYSICVWWGECKEYFLV